MTFFLVDPLLKLLTWLMTPRTKPKPLMPTRLIRPKLKSKPLMPTGLMNLIPPRLTRPTMLMTPLCPPRPMRPKPLMIFFSHSPSQNILQSSQKWKDILELRLVWTARVALK